MKPSDRKALALIVVLSILGVLTVLAAAFVTLSRLERKASLQRMHQTKAVLLARSGIEDVLARIRTGQNPWMPATAWRDDRSPSFHAGMPAPTAMTVDSRVLGYSGRLSDPDRYALRIESGGFHVNGGDPAQAPTLGYNAVLRRMLGTLAEAIDRETMPRHGVLTETDGWTLVDRRPAGGWKDFDQIRRVALGGVQAKLDLLKPYLCLHAWVDVKVIRPTARREWNAQPFRCWAEIRQGMPNARTDPAASPSRDAPDFERVGTRLTGRAPVDLAWARQRKPALIALLAGLEGVYLNERKAEPHGTPLGHAGEDCVGRMNLASIPLNWDTPNDCEGISQQILAWTTEIRTWEQWDAFCNRLVFPNVVASAGAENAAAAAALAAAQQAHDDAQREREDAARAIPGREEELSDAEVGGDEDAIAYAQALLDAARTRLENAEDSLADTLEPLQDALAAFRATRDPADIQEACRSILKANFNPNSDLNKFNPNATQWRLVDKSDLTRYSTEFSLQPLGALRVSSVGRVVDASGRLLARQELEAEVDGPSLLRLTSQGEFVAGNLGNPDVAGDETDFRTPGDPLYLGLSNGTLRTWGRDFLADPLEKGLGLQSYPQPDTGPGRAPASFDGSLQLATIETETDALFGQTGGRMLALARFDQGIDLNVAVGDRTCRPDDLEVTSPDLNRSVLNRTRPNTLFPDGCYAERGREPGYAILGNLPPRHGLISFWAKPNYDFSKIPLLRQNGSTCKRGHLFFHASKTRLAVDRWNEWLQPHKTQFFGLAHALSPAFGGTETLGVLFEISPQLDDRPIERVYRVFPSWPPRTWKLMTFYWDFESSGASSGDQGGEFVLDGTSRGSSDVYGSGVNRPELAEDLTTDFNLLPNGPEHLFVLGSRLNWGGAHGLYWSFCGSGADATFDELAVYDFGQDPSNAAATGLASTRYQGGRYYLGMAYTRYGDPPLADRAPEWTSAPIRLPTGSRLEAISWTLSPSLRHWLELELLSPDAGGYLDGNESSSRSGNVGANQAWGLNRIPGDFRAHVVFRRAPPLPSSLLDTPRLDDLSFTYTPSGGRPILAWERR